MKVTRQTLKTSKDSTLVQLLEDIERQLANIKAKNARGK